jgi:dienelactone hydrolase
MKTLLRLLAVPCLGLLIAPLPGADAPAPTRLLRDLNKSYFPFAPVKDKAAWEARREEVKRRVQVASGLLPMPEKTPLNAVIHGRIERDDYTVEKVFFESLPGNFVTGNLYLPKRHGDKIPAVICPHGHWPNGRFMDDRAGVKKAIASGAEKIENAARSPLQARCVQLARMGCAVFFYDMLGYADSVQFCDAEGKVLHRHGAQEKGFLSPEAELNLCGYFPLQTWNSVRVLDFMTSLPFVDASRIGCTGASGGGTQTLIITGIDDRVTASFPCVMTSTAMQGGCTCENSNFLRIGQGNVDIAALAAPRPLGMTAADDWTKELETKGFPDLKNLYTMLGVPDRVEAHFNIQFPHNYNGVSRAQMYAFMNRHLRLGLGAAALEERDFTFSTTPELSVWDDKHPAPGGERVGTAHELAVIEWFRKQTEKRLTPEITRSGWETLIGHKLPKKGESAFALGTKEDHGDHFIMRGATNCGGTAVDGTFMYPKNWNNAAVLWLSLKGEESVVDRNGDPTPVARKLLAEGYAVACPKLYLQGATKNPNVYAGRKQGYEGFAGYHYGYNPSLLAERVRDALAMVAMIRDNDRHRTERVLIAGVEGAGVIAAATAALSGDAVNELAIDLEGFRFAKLNDVWDVNFEPGSVKYGDTPGLLSLCLMKKAVLGESGAAGPEAVARALIDPK